MYYYVELLRAKRCMRVILIILGLLVLAAIAFRIWAIQFRTPESDAARIEHSPTAHVTQRVLADGVTHETIVDDPAKRTHAVIDRKGSELHMRIVEPSAAYQVQTDNEGSMGSHRESTTQSGGMAHILIDNTSDADFDITALVLGSMVMGLLAATCLGAPLAKENDGHLELTWTKPVSRTSYALACAGIDVTAIVATQILTVVVVLLCALLFTVPVLALSSWSLLALGFAGPIAWYAVLTAIGASVTRGPGMVIGLGWLGAIVVVSVAKGTEHAQSAIGVAIHAISQALAYLDPIAYISFGGEHSDYLNNGAVSTAGAAVAVLFGLAVLYILSAVLQWRRLEA